MWSFRIRSLGLAVLVVLVLPSVLLSLGNASPTIVVLANDGAAGSSSTATHGGQKIIEDSAGKLIAVYVDSSGRLGIFFANSAPSSGGWSGPVKSSSPSVAYARPAAVLASPTSLRIIVEGGTGSGHIDDLPVSIQRDSLSNIVGVSFGSPTVLDSSGFGRNPTAVLAHNGDVLVAWNWLNTGDSSRVKSLRWKLGTGWMSFTGVGNSPDDAIVDSSNRAAMFPNLVQRPDNRHVYIIGNRASSSVSTTLVFIKAAFDGSNWSWQVQNLAYETNASRGIEDATSLAWDPVRASVVVNYEVTGTNRYGVFTIDVSENKSHMDTPSLAVSDNDWGSLVVDKETGDYFLFLIDTSSDGGTGRVGYTTRTSGSWNSTLTVVDSATTSLGLNLRRIGSSNSMDLLYSKGSSAPTSIAFARIEAIQRKTASIITITSSPNPASVSQLVTITGRLTDASTGAALSGKTVLIQQSSSSSSSGGGGSWNPYVSCSPVLTTIETVLGNVVNTNGGADESGGGFPPIGDTDSAKRNLSPPCTVNGQPTYVEIRGVYIVDPPPIEEDCTTSYDPINGGGPYPGGVRQCDTTHNLQTFGTPTGGCTLAVKDSCMHRIHIEIDRDWKAAGQCGSGTVCDDVAMHSITSESTLLDVQGFVFWDQGHLSDDWHAFSGWELHPLTGWRLAGQTLFQTIATVTTGSDGSYTTTTSFTLPGTYSLRAVFTGDTLYNNATSPILSQTIVSQPDFSIAASPNTLTVQAGSAGTSAITLTSIAGFGGTVSLSKSVSPTGPTASLSPTSVTLSSGGSSTSTLTVSTTTSTPAGSYTVTVTGTSGSASHSATVSVTVTPPGDFTVSASPTLLTITPGSSGTSAITLTSVGGFTGAVSVSSTVSPTGPTASLNPASVTLASGGSGTSTLTVSAASSVAAGIYNVVVNGLSGSLSHSITVAVTVTQGNDFNISASPSSVAITAGGSGMSTLTLNSLNGFTGTISLTFTVSPVVTGGPSVAFSPASITLTQGGSATSTLIVTATAGGSYNVTVTGSSSSISHSTSITVNVQDFAVASSPSSLSISVGSSGTSTITLTSLGGYSGPVTLSAAISPSGLGASVSPTSLTLTAGGTAASTLAITTTGSTPPGSFTAIVTATSGVLSHSTAVSIKVVDFSVSATPTTISIVQGSSATSTITLNSLGGFSSTVNLAGSVSSSGLKTQLNPTQVTLSSAGQGNSTLKVMALRKTTPGIYNVTVTGTSGSLSHSVSIIVTVAPRLASASLLENNILVSAGPAKVVVWDAGGQQAAHLMLLFGTIVNLVVLMSSAGREGHKQGLALETASHTSTRRRIPWSIKL